ncbi:MAG: DNA primase [Clostridia bacterium]|nr:DNA primase [Clostridia bacterium]
MLDEYFLSELKNRNPIEEVVGRYVALRRRGRNIIGLCPFHTEKTPSFTLYPENGSFYCFGCGVGGDAIRFVMKAENLEYMEAVRLLAERSGLEMPDNGYDDTQRRTRLKILEINRESARFFNRLLSMPEGKTGLDYIHSRQINDNTVRRFGLGYAPAGWDTLTKHLLAKGFTPSELTAAGVSITGKDGKRVYDRFRNRMVFPLIDLRGNVIAFSCRKIDPEDKMGKYINTNDTLVYKKSRNVFALNLAKNSGADSLILCEGSMDVVMLHQAGFPNAVAAWGTALTSDQARLMHAYTEKIVLTLDADEAGQKATERAIKLLSDEGLDVRVVQIPNGKDPDEFIKSCGKDGRDRFRALIEGAGSDTEYRLFKAMDGININTDEGRTAFLRNAAAVLGSLQSPIERDVYAGKLASKFSVSKDAILNEAKRVYDSKQAERRKKEMREAVAPPSTDRVNSQRRANERAANAEEGLIAVLLRNPDFLRWIGDELPPEQFSTDFNRKIYTLLLNRYAEGLSTDISLLGDGLTPEEIGRIVQIQVRESGRANTPEECRGCARVIKEEKQKIPASKAEEMSDEELRDYMQRLREQKK